MKIEFQMKIYACVIHEETFRNTHQLLGPIQRLQSSMVHKKISEEGREEGKKENVMEIVDNFVLFKFKSKYPTDLQLAQTAACVSFAHEYGALNHKVGELTRKAKGERENESD